MIDLHTHTTASDGRLAPPDLVARAAAGGVTVLAVTDHDTVGGCEAAAAACAVSAIEFVSGIEITAVAAGADVHVLGYFIDIHSQSLLEFLVEQRALRIARLRRNLGLDEVAEKIGVNRKSIADAERGKPSTGIGIYAALLWTYDLIGQLSEVADPTRDKEGLTLALARERTNARKTMDLDNDF